MTIVLATHGGMIYHHTMPKSKIAVTVDTLLLGELDALVATGRFANRSAAIEGAIDAQLARLRRTRLADACAALNVADERAFAEEGLGADRDEWPEY